MKKTNIGKLNFVRDLISGDITAMYYLQQNFVFIWSKWKL